jgi:hypothetical protein
MLPMAIGLDPLALQEDRSMRARQRRKLAKKAAHKKLKQLIHYIISKVEIDEPTKELCILKIRCLLYLSDVVAYNTLGSPILPKGFVWICAADGVDLIWKGDRRGRQESTLHS